MCAIGSSNAQPYPSFEFAEARAGLADDQGVDDAPLDAQSLEKSGRWSRFPLRSRRTVAQHDVIAVQRLEPAVQYLQHRLRIFLVFRRGTDQFSADGERVGKAAAVEIDRELRPLGVGIFRIERRRPAERLGRLVEPPEPVQQVGSMQMVFRYLRSDRKRPVDRLECILDPTAQHLRRGQ